MDSLYVNTSRKALENEQSESSDENYACLLDSPASTEINQINFLKLNQSNSLPVPKPCSPLPKETLYSDVPKPKPSTKPENRAVQNPNPVPPNRSRNPDPRACNRSPGPHGVSQNSVPFNKNHSPDSHARNPSPVPHGRSHSPSPHGRNRSPAPYGRSHSPAAHGRSHSPPPHGRNHSPLPYGRSHSPPSHGRNHSPVPYGGSHSPKHPKVLPRTVNPSKQYDETPIYKPDALTDMHNTPPQFHHLYGQERPPSYSELAFPLPEDDITSSEINLIQEQQQTERKEFCLELSNEISMDDEPDINEQKFEQLKQRISELAEEQEKLRRMNEKHARHLKELFKNETAVKKRVSRSFKRTGFAFNHESVEYASPREMFQYATPIVKPTLPPPTYPPPPIPTATATTAPAAAKLRPGQEPQKQKENSSKELNQLYIQIESLYQNFYKVHLPKGHTVHDTFGAAIAVTKDRNKFVSGRRKKYAEPLPNTENTKVKRPDDKQDTQKPKTSNKNDQNQSSDDMIEAPTPIIGRQVSCSHPRPSIIELTDVTLKWTIYDYGIKCSQETINRRKNESSNSFYLTHHGYRVRLQAYLNGNGESLGKSVSVFLCVLKGDYDSNLKWPAILSFTAILVNQAERKNCLKAVTPPFEFQRPTDDKDSGDAWGFVKFVDLETITCEDFSYIKDETVVFEFKIVDHGSNS